MSKYEEISRFCLILGFGFGLKGFWVYSRLVGSCICSKMFRKKGSQKAHKCFKIIHSFLVLGRGFYMLRLGFVDGGWKVRLGRWLG